ncbi:hypothetical protein BPY_07760 [Bifidobacterium psychraerophilum]|jgi:hypothetical protein|uniref:Uncharacterized protein n=1 Tax=Bifidobacterium psychraerophilum TaxID=218140 RepID=A0A087CDM0_9BIFI|nr:hypothetical protein BPSY_1778 [Bifidobacterium psychraerophilum]PKA95713.1 hypothetical protein A9A89_1991 [Bifidobacterium psychraerophilum DSM 22366]
MNGTRCGIPLCDRTPTKEWDTLRDRPAEAGALGAIPLCEFHMWVLEHGGKLNVQYRG